jgi:hypothetical protein
VLTRQATLKPSGRKPPDLGPTVQAAAVHLSPAGSEASLQTLINGAGLRDWDRDGLLEQDTSAKHMWRGACATNLSLEFELPEPVALGAIEVWNYNAEWQTRDGIRKADVAVSPDGTSWETVLRGAEFAEAEGNADYDEPTQLKLKGATVRKVLFENIVPWNEKGNVGLSKVLLHQAPGPQAGPQSPRDGTTGIGVGAPALEWVAGQGATEHKVYFGTAPDKLALLTTTKRTRLVAPQLKPDTTYYWRVDEAQADGRIVAGRLARFGTVGLVAWWKLDETKGSKAEDASGHEFTGAVMGRPGWAPSQGRIGGAMEFSNRGSFINCGIEPEFDCRDGMTLAAWIKVRQFNKRSQAIVTKGDTGWRLQRLRETGMVEFCFNTAASGEGSEKQQVSLASKRKVDDGQWHQVVGLSDGHRAALYVDGELEASADAKPIAQNAAPLMIGCNPPPSYGKRFEGWIDDVRLYGYGLSEAEVKMLYQGAGPVLRAEK